MENRTYGWYAIHYIHTDGTVSENRRDRSPCNAPGVNNNLQNLTSLGIVDLVPTVDNLLPLLTVRDSPKTEKWTNYDEGERGTERDTIHWVIPSVIGDPTLDPEILRAAFKASPNLTISVISNPNCPEDIITGLFDGTWEDPTKNTKGGEIGCFVLHNRDLPSHLVDLCVRNMRKASNQKDAIYHKNSSRETLVYLVNHGKSDAVKRDALMCMFARGWLKVE